MLRNHAIFSNAENVSGYLVEHNETFYQFDGKQLSVKTYLSFKKNDEVKEAPLPLVLNSNGVTVKAIMLDGRALSTDRYVMTRGKITLSDLPPVFKLEVELTLELISNEKLEDLYNIKGIYPECGITEDATDLVSAFDYIDVMASCEIIKVDDQKQHALLTAGSSAMLAEKITQVKGCSWFQVKCKENLFLHHHQMISLPWFYRSIMIPMVLSTHYHNTELEPIIKHDKNPLHRVEAAKIYVQKLLEKSVAEYDNCKVGSLPPSFVEVFRCVFLDRSLTARYKAAIFSIPSEMDIAVMTKSKDVDVVHMARNQMLDVITERLGIHFSSMYDDEREQKHEEDGALALRNTLDRRQLENVCLFYLSRQSDKKIKTLLMNRFREMLVSSLPDCIFCHAMSDRYVSVYRKNRA